MTTPSENDSSDMPAAHAQTKKWPKTARNRAYIAAYTRAYHRAERGGAPLEEARQSGQVAAQAAVEAWERDPASRVRRGRPRPAREAKRQKTKRARRKRSDERLIPRHMRRGNAGRSAYGVAYVAARQNGATREQARSAGTTAYHQAVAGWDKLNPLPGQDGGR